MKKYFRTGLGYYKKNGLIVGKFHFSVGEHTVLEDYEFVEVETEKEFNEIVIEKAPEQIKKEKRERIIGELDRLDRKIIRPLAEKETQRVKEIVDQKIALRIQLNEEQ